MRTLILGLGSRGFEGERVGLEVARGLYATLADPDVDIVEAYDTDACLFAGCCEAAEENCPVEAITVED